MTDWGAFAGFTGVVVLLFLLLARASQALVPPETGADGRPSDAARPSTGPLPSESSPAPTQPAGTATGEPPDGGRTFGSGELLANVLATQGLFAGLVAAGAVYWAVPPSALGLGSTGPGTVALGAVVGVSLYVLDEVGAAGAALFGVEHDETLRGLLAPDSRSGWVLLLGGVLPVVAVAEELVFRGALVGALAAGFALPVWGLAVGSSVLFALGHGAQGRGGVVVTGLLGFALAAAFVVTGSLVVVVVAHYLVNVLEFVVHEGLGVEWAGG